MLEGFSRDLDSPLPPRGLEGGLAWRERRRAEDGESSTAGRNFQLLGHSVCVPVCMYVCVHMNLSERSYICMVLFLLPRPLSGSSSSGVTCVEINQTTPGEMAEPFF